MNRLPLKLKILIMFLVPTIALLYVTIVFIDLKYTQLQSSSASKAATEITSTLSTLIHNLQLERGLSAGYIASSSENKKLIDLSSQFKLTDASYKSFLDLIQLHNQEKKQLHEKISYKVEPLVKNIVKKLSELKNIRKKVLENKIDFVQEIEFYTAINDAIIKIIKIINETVNIKTTNSHAIVVLHYLKESAGLERAYIYNQLLSKKFKSRYLEKIKQLQEVQKKYEDDFFTVSSVDAAMSFYKYIDGSIKKDIKSTRENFINKKLNNTNAQRWFMLKTQYIDSLDTILSVIFDSHMKNSEITYEKASEDLLIVFIISGLSFFILTCMTFIIFNLMRKEEKLLSEVMFSAYAFESHEAIVITDVNANIMKINQAFSEITGYTFDEVNGKNIRTLKSDRHGKDFFKDMWYKISTVGKWNGEIYNKRKNGEIFPELLSITAIKNEKKTTTHYIAQFSDISELKAAQEKAQYQANHDFLTGLDNRKAITQRLKEEFAKSKRHNFLEAFLFIDLDEFKQINDTHGHHIGDLLLVEFAHRLRNALREEDLLARISGDEFAIIISNSNNSYDEMQSATKEVCKKIFNSISKKFILEDTKIKIGASIGVSIFPLQQANYEDVINEADSAMYKAKRNGKNRVEFYKNI